MLGGCNIKNGTFCNGEKLQLLVIHLVALYLTVLLLMHILYSNHNY